MTCELVRDIMVSLSEYPCISETNTLAEAIEQMRNTTISTEGIHSLPRMALVFDDDGHKLLGVLRRRDIMRGLAPRFLAGGTMDYRKKLFDIKIDLNIPELASGSQAASIKERSRRKVKDFMIPIKATIDGSDHMMKAVYEMVELNVSVLPVIEDGRVVGVVRSVEVLRALRRVIQS